jgi:hypothetical protein
MKRPSHPVCDFLSHSHLAPVQSHESLSVWPIVRDADAPACGPEYIALGTALASKTLRIDEVSTGGEVPKVHVENDGEVAVLFLFGEEIRGAKQNRVANASFLVPGKSETVIDVSCVEAGRWSRSHGERFRGAHGVISPALRRRMAGQVRDSLQQRRGFRSNQQAVWEDIGERLGHARTVSETRSYADYSNSRAPDLDEMTRAFTPIEDQVGFVACIDGEVAGLELIGRPDVFAVAFPSLLRAYGIDSLDATLVRKLDKRPARSRGFEGPEAFLAELSDAPCSFGQSLGLGVDLRFESARIAGCALACEGLVHATAFPA